MRGSQEEAFLPEARFKKDGERCVGVDIRRLVDGSEELIIVINVALSRSSSLHAWPISGRPTEVT